MSSRIFKKMRKISLFWTLLSDTHKLLVFKAANNYTKLTKLKKALDKRRKRVYNGIVNSKGAADRKSVALFFCNQR